jgi:hypothetical protein
MNLQGSFNKLNQVVFFLTVDSKLNKKELLHKNELFLSGQ